MAACWCWSTCTILNMKYFDELKRSMEMLAEHPKTLFLGQAVECAGTGMTNTLKDVSNEKKLDIDAVKLKNILSKSIDAKILGPVNAPIYRINQKFRNRLLIRAKKTSSIQKKLKDVLNEFQLSKGMKLSVDVDPISFN